MPQQVYLRPFDKKRDEKLLAEWLYAGRKENRFDPEIFKRSQVEIYTVFTEREVIGFIPVTRAFLVESLAFKPGLERVIEARALQAFQHIIVERASSENVPDAFFFTMDQSLLDFVGIYGWIKPDVPMRHLHFANLEPKPVERDDENL